MRAFSTTVNTKEAEFDDKVMLANVSDYMVTLYRHLKKLTDQLNKLNQEFMDKATADADSEKLVALRKQISSMGVYAKLFGDFQSLLKEMQACRELLAEDDKEIKMMAEDDLASL